METLGLLSENGPGAPKGERNQKAAPLMGSVMRRKRFYDITNIASNGRSERSEAEEQENPNVVPTKSAKDYIAMLLKENNALLRLVDERNKIIDITGLELQKLKLSLQKANQQNWQLAQANSHMLAELNLGKDRELAFQRLIFITMLAWENPYSDVGDSHVSLENSCLQMKLVGEEAFVRIAPAVAGVADISTAHLYKVLAGGEKGISLSLWTTYVAELIKVHQGRKSHQTRDVLLFNEHLLCVGSSRTKPVLKWENNIAWPGNLTLTDNALYFECHFSIRALEV